MFEVVRHGLSQSPLFCDIKYYIFLWIGINYKSWVLNSLGFLKTYEGDIFLLIPFYGYVCVCVCRDSVCSEYVCVFGGAYTYCILHTYIFERNVKSL